MKKTIAVLLAVCLAPAATATVYTVDIREDSDPKAGNTQVTFQVDPTYTVTISATITPEKQTAQDGTVTYENDLTITADDVRLTQNTAIGISLESDFTMDVTKASASNPYQLPYQVFVGEQEITAERPLAALFDTQVGQQSATLHITANNPVYAGTYSDTVTFTIQNLY